MKPFLLAFGRAEYNILIRYLVGVEGWLLPDDSGDRVLLPENIGFHFGHDGDRIGDE